MGRIVAFDRVDACVLGRVMYPEHEEYWRGVVAGADETPEPKRYAEFADRPPHYVPNPLGHAVRLAGLRYLPSRRAA